MPRSRKRSKSRSRSRSRSSSRSKSKPSSYQKRVAERNQCSMALTTVTNQSTELKSKHDTCIMSLQNCVDRQETLQLSFEKTSKELETCINDHDELQKRNDELQVQLNSSNQRIVAYESDIEHNQKRIGKRLRSTVKKLNYQLKSSVQVELYI